MKRSATDCHSCSQVRLQKTRLRPSDGLMTWTSEIAIQGSDTHSRDGERSGDQDICADCRIKPKATLYLNARAEELAQRAVTEPNPLAMFKESCEEHAIDTAYLILQKSKTPARFVEEVLRSIFVPEMRQFFTKKIRKLLRKRKRSGTLSESQQRKLMNGFLRLDDWETSSQVSSGLFSLERFENLIEAINDAMDEARAYKKDFIAKEELNQDKYADQIILALQDRYHAPDQSIKSLHMTWLAVLRPVFKMTASMETQEAHEKKWRAYIGSALKENHIGWVLGASHSHLTAMIAQRVVSNEESQERIVAMSSIVHPREFIWFKDRGECINFGCEFPLKEGLPNEIVRGFAQLQDNLTFGSPKPGLINHYKKALRLLEEFQSEPHIELLCMLSLTVGMTSDMTVYIVPQKDAKDEVARFAIANSSQKPKRGGTRAALLALRMLWYLMPDKFVWKKAYGEDLEMEEKTVYSIQYMRRVTEQYMITNHMIAALGWLDRRKGSVYATSADLKIAPKETLDARLQQLRSLMSKPTDFVRAVFQSDDPKWVDQCKAIIK
ncbi:hypothetical protein V8C35DRAFT_308762 [Trichoderma chlorosporum]